MMPALMATSQFVATDQPRVSNVNMLAAPSSAGASLLPSQMAVPPFAPLLASWVSKPSSHKIF
jgi:hypothetical protein